MNQTPPNQHQHPMPFGAECLASGGTRFQLWAPGASRVDLCLQRDQTSEAIPMEARQDGWFELEHPQAGPGSRYQYRINEDLSVPDPASRFQPIDLHGPSEVIDPKAFYWQDSDWRGRPWEAAVFYELHVGTFTARGDYQGVIERLDWLVALGITAIELMPIAAFPGKRNWGYDGALLFSPAACYGRPEELKTLIQAAHQRGLMVFLDVVYNHFGPEGNYLHLYAPQFFTERHHTPWGAGLNIDGPASRWVRDFFIHNALYWLEEYRFDGLRLDAVHAIQDDSTPTFLEELADAVQARFANERLVHLVLENDDNQPELLNSAYRAQWNDDFHHAAHVLLTGETGGYYQDYADHPAQHLARSLAEGFAYQGERSSFRGNRPRGAPSASLPPIAFVNFLQNHDQAGNRAFGERLDVLCPPEALRAALSILLLAPAPPLLLMGQEFAASTPFLFFCDFGDDLAKAVTQGRRREFASFPEFSDPDRLERIPDPNDPKTFLRSGLDWNQAERAHAQDWIQLHRELLELRQKAILPRLAEIQGDSADFELYGERAFSVHWRLRDDSRLRLTANLSPTPLQIAPSRGLDPDQTSRPLHAEPHSAVEDLASGRLPPWSAVWRLTPD